jgi:hypothetical protein
MMVCAVATAAAASFRVDEPRKPKLPMHTVPLSSGELSGVDM